jgi:ribokinase
MAEFHMKEQMAEGPEVIVMGSFNIDLIGYCPRLPMKGETVHGTSYEKDFGGKGANQAVQCSLLGVNTYFCGKVGEDEFGAEYIERLEKVGINTTYVKKQGPMTGMALIGVESSGANTIVIIPGANGLNTCDDILEMRSAMEQAKVLICQNEVPIVVTRECLKLARETNTLSIFNPGPAAPANELLDLIVYSDIVCPNETELEVLTGMKTSTDEEILAAARVLINVGCKVVLVTLGAKGALVVTSTESKFVAASKVIAVNTVGAGDSFIGTLGANLARGVTLEQAVDRALAVATLSVTRNGAQGSYYKADELPEAIRPTNTSLGKDTVTKDMIQQNLVI